MSTTPLDGFEAVFSVSVDRDTAWTNLLGATPPAGVAEQLGTDRRWMPAFEDVGEVLEADEGKRLRVRKANLPCAGTEIVIVLEDEGSGARITVTQTGFGEVGGFRPWLAAGWTTIVADLVVALERGVQLRRHLAPWVDLGCAIEERDAGLVVVSDARPGSLADSIGLRTDDLVVTVAGAPVTSVADLALLARGILRAGDEVAVGYLRGSDRFEATGPAG